MTKKPTVFVSAVSAELQIYRRAAADELRRLAVEPDEQRDFTGDAVSIREQLREKIQRSDAVFCLVGDVSGDGPARLQPTRSWTQWEYHWAKEFGKPIFLFFPKPDCRLGDGNDTAEQRERQRLHRRALQASEDALHWFEFCDPASLQLEVSRAVTRMRERMAAPDLERQIARSFPTPLADLFIGFFSKQGVDDLREMLRETLRWIACLNLHDALVNCALDSTTSMQLATGLRKQTTPADCHLLLQSVCAVADDASAERFVSEFPSWYHSQSRGVGDLLLIMDKLGIRQPKEQKAKLIEEFKSGLVRLYSSLEFLERYVLAVVEGQGADPSHVTFRMLRGRGDAVQSFSAILDPANAFLPACGEIYLLSLERRRALYLQPAFYYSAVGGDQVFGCGAIDRDERSVRMVLERFGQFREVQMRHSSGAAWRLTETDECVECDVIKLLASWLGPRLAPEILGDSIESATQVWHDKFLSDASWSDLHKRALPHAQEANLGGRYRIRGRPLHSGFFADLHEPERLSEAPAPEAHEEPPNQLIHVLREDVDANTNIQDWFRRRIGYWRAIGDSYRRGSHYCSADEPAAVLRIVDCGPTERAWLLTDRVPNAGTLQQRVGKRDVPLDDRLVRRVMVAAAELCCAAYDNGLRILSLPLRHFLFDADDRLLFTGFDATVEAKTATWLRSSSVREYLREICRDDDWSAIDPELSREVSEIPATVDVFALGVLLARLRFKDEHPLKALGISEWLDDWECIRYHCLAVDPHQRFQSPHQVLRAIQDRCGTCPPVRIPEGRALGDADCLPEVPGFAIQAMPVTNAEYLRFCRSTGRAGPHYFQPDTSLDTIEAHRLAAPWLPICGINLSDATDYCRWLNRDDGPGSGWRLPTEREWLRAAVLDRPQLYPWGDDAPSELRANYRLRFRGPTVVGAFAAGASPAGCYDMAGNVWEWCADYSPDESPCRVLKGGAFGFGTDSLVVTSRFRAVATYRSSHIGLRLVRSEQ